MPIPVYQVNIRRDAGTITPVDVPEYEIPILQTIFGEENVHNPKGGAVIDNPPTEAVGMSDVTGSEFDRLAAKYGANDEGLIVEQVYGKKAAKGLESRLAAAEKEAEAASKPSKKAAATE